MKIIVYVLDSLRYDHVSCYGYGRKTTPNIDGLAADGIIFERCYAPSTWTRPVAASLLSGTYPGVHGVRGRRDMFTARIPRLPGLLQLTGFKTACVSAIGNVSTAMGFGEGFDYFCDLYKEPALLQKRKTTTGAIEGLDERAAIVFPYAEDINDHFLPWLRNNFSADVFALLWSIQPHAPYEPPDGFHKFVSPAYDGRFAGQRDMVRRVRNDQDAQDLVDLYDSEIYYNDHKIGEIIRELKKLGEFDDTLFIVTGDHGEAFGEHELFSHGHLPYDVVMRVPMVVKLPGSAHRGTKIKSNVSLLDITPTLLAYTGVSYPEELRPILMGENLLPLLENPDVRPHEHLFCETMYSDTKPIFYGVADGEWKYLKTVVPKLGKKNLANLWKRLIHERVLISILRNPLWLLKRYGRLQGEMLYHLQSDPGENENLVSERPDVLSRMQMKLSSWLDECRKIADEYVTGYESGDDDEIMRRHLQALGYLD